ncbi:phosphomannomutase [Pelagibacterium montanilacus]|uniref:phosphomannomutase n=1 Tax=Pelagibacterium montanilacus TaxID=2185280 RepID=UPI000F8D9DA0|nr:phosphomannomutase [Pelagibacterium montanilacus]
MGDRSDIAFGTSGLRGPASGFDAALVDAHVAAFARVCLEPHHNRLLIGRDLRASSPEIAALVAASAVRLGLAPIDCCAVPTPALALAAARAGMPAIMVTGSHIPADRNGLKFYRPEGELRKADEGPIARIAADLLAADGLPDRLPDPMLPSPAGEDAAERYCRRFTDWFAPDALAGLTIGVFEHSSVGRDLLVAIIEALGATCHRFGKSESFIAVDTEAVDAEHLAQISAEIARHGLDCVVSTDGDADRPLLVDGAGRQIAGDVLGALTARALGIEAIVTPITSTTALEASGWFARVVRTRIGSPYVVEAMEALGDRPVLGFEANGGVLTLGTVHSGERELGPLVTRDAVLPLVAVLAASVAASRTLTEMAADLPARIMAADRVRDVDPESGTRFLDRIQKDRAARSKLHAELAGVAAIDLTDGVRLTLQDGRIVHFRQSGNAPEMRCYVETGSAGETAELLGALIARMKDSLGEEIESR